MEGGSLALIRAASLGRRRGSFHHENSTPANWVLNDKLKANKLHLKSVSLMRKHIWYSEWEPKSCFNIQNLSAAR
jgi:hypothetical protein